MSLKSPIPGWLVLMAALTALGPLSIDMYLPSFPAIAQSLGTDRGSVERTLAAFLIGLALGQLFYGPLSDRFGRKPPLYVGLAIYVAASLGCVFASSIDALTALRFFQALGGSAGMVIARAVIRDRSDTRGSAQALSLLMLVMGVAPILAPLLGGALLTLTGWHGIFIFLSLFGGGVLVAVVTRMQETVHANVAAKISLGSVLANYGRLLRDRHFMACAAAGGLGISGMFAYIVGSPHIFIEHYEITPGHYGFLFGLNAIGIVGGSQVNARLLRKYPPQQILRKALWGLPIASLTGLSLAASGLINLPLLMLCLFVFIGSLGFIGPNATALALAGQGARTGAASALLGTLQFVCGTLAGVAVSLAPNAGELSLLGVMSVCGVGALLLGKAGISRHGEPH
jgi:DHA1 family bicyclomycin/chloramphenicol resistance-like MFS transporter